MKKKIINTQKLEEFKIYQNKLTKINLFLKTIILKKCYKIVIEVQQIPKRL